MVRWRCAVRLNMALMLLPYTGMQRLAAYCHGDNEPGVQMELTLPLLVAHVPKPHPHPWEARPYKVALFLPHKFQASLLKSTMW